MFMLRKAAAVAVCLAGISLLFGCAGGSTPQSTETTPTTASSSAAPTSSAVVDPWYTSANFFTLVTTGNYQYQLHEPINKKPGVTYPIFVLLHGSGGHTYFLSTPGNYPIFTNLIRKMNADRDFYEAYVVIPIEENWGPSPDKTMNIIQQVLDKGDADPRRIYISGVSMGGFATCDFILTYPDVPACAVPICGATTDDRVSGLVDMPIRIYHSSDDTVVSVETSRCFYNALKDAGSTKVEYDEQTSYGHSRIDSYAYSLNHDLYEWMFRQKKP